MCDKFSDPDNGKFCIDGWSVPERFVATTGKPAVLGAPSQSIKESIFMVL